jgi:hypothetical protein
MIQNFRPPSVATAAPHGAAIPRTPMHPVATAHPIPVTPNASGAPISPAGPAGIKPAKLAEQPIELSGDQPGAAPSKIRATGVGEVKAAHAWKRTPHLTGTGAIRMRTFHGRLSDQGVEYLDNAVNEWLDGHPEIEVKFVTSTIGIFEGKIKDLALVLNLWY